MQQHSFSLHLGVKTSVGPGNAIATAGHEVWGTSWRRRRGAGDGRIGLTLAWTELTNPCREGEHRLCTPVAWEVRSGPRRTQQVACMK